MSNNIKDLFTDIADAIRNKNGSTNKIVAKDFPNEIKNISSSSGNIEVCNIEVKSYDGYTVFLATTYENNEINCVCISDLGAEVSYTINNVIIGSVFSFVKSGDAMQTISGGLNQFTTNSGVIFNAYEVIANPGETITVFTHPV